jgi:hypothetical protein
MPFVQGQLRRESLTVSVRTECAHCARPMRIRIDSALHCVVEEGGDPLVFVPLVNFAKLKARNIIDDF